jgi:hypothetical protein
MAFEHREGSGNLFKNSRKQKDTHPDYQGECLINGKLMQIAGWIKDGKAGSYLSLRIEPKREMRKPAAQDSGRSTDGDEFGDSIPFN